MTFATTTRDFEMLLFLGTTEDALKLARLSPHIERVVNLRIVRDNNEKLAAKLPPPIGRGPLPLTRLNVQTVMALISRYLDRNEFECDVAHTLALALLFDSECKTIEAAPAEHNNVCSALLLTMLVHTTLPVLLTRQMRFISNNYAATVAVDPNAPITISTALQQVFLLPSHMMPLFDDLRKSSPAYHNVASCLLGYGLQKYAYDCMRVLFTEATFACSVSLASFAQVQRASAQALLAVVGKQQADASDAVAFIDEDFVSKTLVPIANGDIAKPFDQLLALFTVIERRMRLRERFAAIAAQKSDTTKTQAELDDKNPGDTMLIALEPEVAVQRASAILANRKRVKTHLENTMLAIRNSLIAVCGENRKGYLPHLLNSIRAPVGINGRVGEKKSEEDDILLEQIEKEDESSSDSSDSDDDDDSESSENDKAVVVQSAPIDLKHSLRIGSGILEAMLMVNERAPEEALTWCDVAILQALYRYYDLRVLPDVQLASEAVRKSQADFNARKEAEKARQREQLTERMKQITAASYWGEDDDDDDDANDDED